jgi:hypothetical protein
MSPPALDKKQRRKLLAIVIFTDLLVFAALIYHFLFRTPPTP